MKCAHCGSIDGVELESSRTAYPFEGQIGSEADPNKPVLLCRPCAVEHHKRWDEMWDEWRNQQGAY